MTAFEQIVGAVIDAQIAAEEARNQVCGLPARDLLVEEQQHHARQRYIDCSGHTPPFWKDQRVAA